MKQQFPELKEEDRGGREARKEGEGKKVKRK
jgi:hypothetical protein